MDFLKLIVDASGVIIEGLIHLLVIPSVDNDK